MHERSEYNREQAKSFLAIRAALSAMEMVRLDELREMMEPYLAFRRDLDAFHARHVLAFCSGTCFDTGISACCGFESIFTYFADQVIAWVHSSDEQRGEILRVLSRPNTTRHCVYLGVGGCILGVSPVSCAMFLCDQVKEVVGERAGEEWKRLCEREKSFTRPDKPILFDDIERIFILAGVDSPHMYCHRLPGLLRLKACWAGKG